MPEVIYYFDLVLEQTPSPILSTLKIISGDPDLKCIVSPREEYIILCPIFLFWFSWIMNRLPLFPNETSNEMITITPKLGSKIESNRELINAVSGKLYLQARSSLKVIRS